MLQHDCTNSMLLTYHIKYSFAVGLTFGFVTDIMALRGGRFNESNAESSHSRGRSNVNNQVPRDPSKRTMITLDGGGFTTTTIRMIIYIIENMFNGYWTTWNKDFFQWGVVDDVLVCGVWEDCIRKLYPNLMSNPKEDSIKMAQLDGVQFDGSDFLVLKPYNPKWIKSTYWEDMIDRGCLVLAYCCSKGRLVAVAWAFGIECVKCEWLPTDDRRRDHENATSSTTKETEL
nr:transposase, Ptta/En/Spm [Tanacetum cinerariifolium]